MALSLTTNDVLQLVNNHDSDARISVTKKISFDYLTNSFSPEEITIAEEIFRLLAKDVEVRVRATLSESLKLAKNLPHDIALQLAKDVAEVAIPMLQFSEVLTEEDLCDIVNDSEVQKILAVARRKNLTRTIRNTLMDTGNPEVLEIVCSNNDFISSEQDYEELIDKYAGNSTIMRKIIGRASLPTVLVEKMMSEVSSNIVKEIRSKYNITPAALDTYASHSLEISVLSVIDHSSKNSEIDYLVNHLYNFGKLTPSIILSGLCMGRKRFFISSLAKRAGIPITNAEIIIRDGGRRGLSLLLAKAGIPEKLSDAVELVIKLTDEKKATDNDISVKDFCKWLIGKLEFFADSTQIEYLSYMMAIAKQSQRYRVYEN